MQSKYVGWVPCIAGNLTFAFTACEIGKDHAYLNANHVENDKQLQKNFRYVAISSTADWKDIKTDLEGRWHVVLLASAEEDAEELIGTVFLLPVQSVSESFWNGRIISLLKEIGQKVHDKEDVKSIHHQLMQELNASNSKSKVEPIYGASFKLKSSGLCYLSLTSSPEESQSQNVSKLICRQAYYYVKYAFHRHKHHLTSESLTSIHKVSSMPEITGIALIREIKRAMVQLARDASPADFKSFFAAKGILSYAKSLAYTCKLEGLIAPETYLAEKAYIDNMSESLEIQGRKVETSLIARAAFNSNFRSVGLLVFAMLAPFTLLFKDQIYKMAGEPPSDHVVKALAWIMHDEAHLGIVVATILVFYFFLRSLALRYGSPNFAVQKLHKMSLIALDFITNNERSAKVIFLFLVILFFVGLITTSLKLFS